MKADGTWIEDANSSISGENADTIKINTTDILDHEKAISAAAYDLNLLKDLIEIFSKDIPLQIDAVNSSIEKRDFETVGRLCHKLRGSIGTIGGISFTALIHQVEVAAQNGDFEGCLGKAANLHSEFAKLQAVLNAFDWSEYVS